MFVDIILIVDGELAQLARAPALHAGGQGFESLILHQNQQTERSRFYQHHENWIEKQRQRQRNEKEISLFEKGKG